MKPSLRTKLSLSYVFVAMFCVFLLSILTNSFLDRHFKDYVIRNQNRKNVETVSLLSRQFNDNGSWDAATVENIGINALEQGMILKVTDEKGKVIWDATVHNNGLCQQMIEHMAHNMNSRYPNWKGEYVENKYPLKKDQVQLGTVQIGYYGPFYFNDSDLAFINTINQVLMAVGALSLLLSLLVGTVMAKRLSTPISRVIHTARMISRGSYGDRLRETSTTREIFQLTETVNDLAETLEKQELLRKRLTGDVAHELRTPLATLQSHMEAMIDGIWKPDTERLKSCHEEIMRISRMVGDLEKLARAESENLVLDKSRFEVSDAIRQSLRNFEAEFSAKGVELRFDGDGGMLYADRDKISQVLVNLLSNALKYTPAGGLVEVSAKSDADVTEISVKDTGFGIAPEDLPHIFERFYRADQSRNRMTGGAGIGLTISRAIVEAHKGKIEVVSNLHEGTEFIVTLPRQEE